MKAKSPVFLFPDMKTTKRMGYTAYGEINVIVLAT